MAGLHRNPLYRRVCVSKKWGQLLSQQIFGDASVQWPRQPRTPARTLSPPPPPTPPAKADHGASPLTIGRRLAGLGLEVLISLAAPLTLTHPFEGARQSNAVRAGSATHGTVLIRGSDHTPQFPLQFGVSPACGSPPAALLPSLPQLCPLVSQQSSCPSTSPASAPSPYFCANPLFGQ